MSAAGATLFVTGLSAEARIVRSLGTDPVVEAPAFSLADKLAAFDPRGIARVVSFGLAGGLDPGVRVGDVVVAGEILRDGEGASASCDAALSDMLATAVRAAGGRPVRGRLVGADRPVMSRGDKRALGERRAAIAVDTESHLAAAFAASHGIAFATLRAVCDTAAHDLPPLALDAVGPDGELRWGLIGRELAHRPHQLLALPRTALASARALAVLRRVRRRLVLCPGALG